MIVDGYKDGVLIAGAAYLGPAASIGKVVGGGVIAEIANGSYQWFDLNQPGNENKTGTGRAVSVQALQVCSHQEELSDKMSELLQEVLSLPMVRMLVLLEGQL